MIAHRAVVSACTLYLVFKEPAFNHGQRVTAARNRPLPLSLSARRGRPSSGEPSEVTLRSCLCQASFSSPHSASHAQTVSCRLSLGFSRNLEARVRVRGCFQDRQELLEGIVPTSALPTISSAAPFDSRWTAMTCRGSVRQCDWDSSGEPSNTTGHRRPRQAPSSLGTKKFAPVSLEQIVRCPQRGHLTRKRSYGVDRLMSTVAGVLVPVTLPSPIRTRKMSRFPRRTTKSWPSIASSCVS